MSLQDELDALRAEFVRSAPPGRAALYEAKVDELRRTFPIEKALKTGDHADFTLPNPSGRAVSLSALLRSGPAVVTFYRGGWCPYCNLQLRAYQQALGEITALGAKLIAISPQLPGGSTSLSGTCTGAN
jgi:thiol-disulfide isomerase/thioredoxin